MKFICPIETFTVSKALLIQVIKSQRNYFKVRFVFFLIEVLYFRQTLIYIYIYLLSLTFFFNFALYCTLNRKRLLGSIFYFYI